jgi:hypothetical protein
MATFAKLNQESNDIETKRREALREEAKASIKE